MKKSIKLIALFFLITFTSCKEAPVEYYNHAVTAGNLATNFDETISRIERFENGIEAAPIGLVKNVNMRLPYSEKFLGELKDKIGNSDTDPMIKSAIAYLEHDINSIKDPKAIQFMQALDKKLTIEELDQLFEQQGEFITKWDESHTALWETYNAETSKYAKANGILEEYFGGAK